MASNHFFSGRIPNELYEQAEKHCKETGDSKTEVLIKALSTYLNFPIAIPGKNLIAPASEVTKEMFERLEERLKILEDYLKVIPIAVINTNNNDNKVYDLAKEDTKQNVINIDNTNNSDEKIQKSGNDKPDVIADDNNVDNKNLQLKLDEPQILENISELPKFEEIITADVVKKSSLKRHQIDYLTDKAIEKIKGQGKVIEAGKILEEPIEVIHKDGIEVNGYPYRLFYAGENFKERVVWNLIPDNEGYQNVITGLLDSNTTLNNNSYQVDNNKDFKEKNLINKEIVQENRNLFIE